MVDPKPWLDIIPAEDTASFARAYDAAERPMTAGTRPAIVFVDLTLAFVDSAYPTGHSDTGWPTVGRNASLLAVARELEVPVYFTKAYPDPSHRSLPQERGRWKSASRKPVDLPPGDVIVDPLTPRDDEIVIHKADKPSAFFGTPLASYLVYQEVDTVIVTGMTTSGCVRATVLDAFMNNFNVVVPFDCSADRSQISHKVNLFDMHMKYADVVSLAETLAYLRSVVPTPQPATA